MPKILHQLLHGRHPRSQVIPGEERIRAPAAQKRPDPWPEAQTTLFAKGQVTLHVILEVEPPHPGSVASFDGHRLICELAVDGIGKIHARRRPERSEEDGPRVGFDDDPRPIPRIALELHMANALVADVLKKLHPDPPRLRLI